MGVPYLRVDQMRGDDAVNDAQHLAHDLGPAGEQEARNGKLRRPPNKKTRLNDLAEELFLVMGAIA